MTGNSKIDDLIRRIKAATGPDRGLDGAIAVASGQYDEHFQGRDGARANEGWVSRNGGARVPAPRYTASIEAALTLVPVEWSQWWQLGRGLVSVFGAVIRRYEGQIYEEITGNAVIAPAAICIAALRARAATPPS